MSTRPASTRTRPPIFRSTACGTAPSTTGDRPLWSVVVLAGYLGLAHRAAERVVGVGAADVVVHRVAEIGLAEAGDAVGREALRVAGRPVPEGLRAGHRPPSAGVVGDRPEQPVPVVR